MANGETKVTLDKDGNIRVVLGDKLKEGLKKTGLNPNPKNFTIPKSSYKKMMGGGKAMTKKKMMYGGMAKKKK